MSSPPPPAFGRDQCEERDLSARNRVLIVPSVICSHLVAEAIAEAVPAAVALPHDHGCAQLGVDKDTTQRTLINVARNPNVAAALVVGLGCEGVQPDEVATGIERSEVPVDTVVIQEAGGTDPCISTGIEAANTFTESVLVNEKDSIKLGDISLGVVSSDLRDSTLRIAEPLVTQVMNDVIDAGGRVIVAGRQRFQYAGDDLENRFASDQVWDEFADLIDSQTPDDRVTAVDRKAADLPTESLLGILGDRQITEVLRYGDHVTIPEGLAIVNASLRFGEAATALAAAGSNVIIHVTDEGVPTGHPIAPVLKVSGNSEIISSLPDDIDIDAQRTTPADLRNALIATANGAQTCAERHGVTEFSISRFGPSM